MTKGLRIEVETTEYAVELDAVEPGDLGSARDVTVGLGQEVLEIVPFELFEELLAEGSKGLQ
jgi:hypothetical protein